MSFPNLPTDNIIDQILSLSPDKKKLISSLYDTIFNISSPSLDEVRSRWEMDMGGKFSDESWEACLKLIHTSSPCARHGLIQLKIVLRAHLTNARLADMYPNMDPSCPRCKGQPADYIHMFWSCPKLSIFWTNIFDAYTKIFKKTVLPNPLCAIFGVMPRPCLIKGNARTVIAFTSLIARRNILLCWKQQYPPQL